MRYGKMKNKGQAIILIAGITLGFLLIFAVLAIDFTRMYYVRGELQSAADSAALAGASLLLDPLDKVQDSARKEAIKFALNNKAAGSPVTILTDNLNVLGDNNDITVGFWNGTSYTAATAAGKDPVNAIEVRPQRVTGLEAARGPVGFLFPKLIPNLTSMGVRRIAVALVQLKPFAPFPLCFSTCGIVTPLSVQPGNSAPGLKFFMKPKDAKDAGNQPVAAFSTYLQTNTSDPLVTKYINGLLPVPPLCGQCINTNQGLTEPLCDVRAKIAGPDAGDYLVNGTTIHGWKVLVPIISTPCAGGAACTDPGWQPGDAYRVINFAEVIITDAVPPGSCGGTYSSTEKPSIVLVGLGSSSAGNSSIQCTDCNPPNFKPYYNIKLIK